MATETDLTVLFPHWQLHFLTGSKFPLEAAWADPYCIQYANPQA